MAGGNQGHDAGASHGAARPLGHWLLFAQHQPLSRAEGWLLAERPVPEAVRDVGQATATEPQEKEEEQIKYWFSVLPEDTSLSRLVLLAHAPWVNEQFYEDAKQECGLDHYQGRRGPGLHRHRALVMLAYSSSCFFA